MRPWRLVVTVTALCVSVASCALLPGRGGSDDLDDLAEPVPREVTLEVDNQNYYDATIYAIRPGERRRLGFVGGLTKGQFAFLWTDYDLRVEIYLMALGSYYARPISVDPGDEITLVVQPNLHKYRPGTVF